MPCPYRATTAFALALLWAECGNNGMVNREARTIANGNGNEGGNVKTRDEILDEMLLNLADGFESGNRTVRTFSVSSVEEYEPLRECFAWMVAEGFARSFPTPQCWMVSLTPEGYKHFKPRIDALRALAPMNASKSSERLEAERQR